MAPKGILASDGLLARPSGRWAREKLGFLARYIDIFATGQQHKWRDRAFIDLLAGPGLCRLRTGQEEFDGSPLIALKSRTPFTQVMLVEEEPALAAALRVRTQGPRLQPHPTILEGNCNDSAIVVEIRRRVTRSTLAFCFVDLEGFDVEFNTIRALVADRRMDLVVTFPEGGITRNAPVADPRQAATWTRFFGTEAWRTVLSECAAKQRSRSPRIELALLYARQLQGLGYEVNYLHETMKNTTGVALYRPLFASKHARGTDYWLKISAVGPDRQRHLFP